MSSTEMITVRCLSEAEKAAVAWYYSNYKYPIKNLAVIYKTSPRTIGRVLHEKGLATPVPRIKGEAKRVMDLLKKYGVTLEVLESALESHCQPTKPSYDRKQAALFQPAHTMQFIAG